MALVILSNRSVKTFFKGGHQCNFVQLASQWAKDLCTIHPKEEGQKLGITLPVFLFLVHPLHINDNDFLSVCVCGLETDSKTNTIQKQIRVLNSSGKKNVCVYMRACLRACKRPCEYNK